MKMKKKLILLTAMLALMLAVLSITAFADDTSAEEELEISAEASASEADDKGTAALTEEASIFDEIYRRLTENADKIFAALAFFGTMVVSFTYKKGLLPLLGRAMTALKGSVDTIRENGSELTRRTDDALGALSEKAQNIADESLYTKAAVSQINERLDTLDTVTEQYDTLRVVLSSQIDMLYAIFMSSALPQYQKEEVGNKINRMKEELTKYEKIEE